MNDGNEEIIDEEISNTNEEIIDEEISNTNEEIIDEEISNTNEEIDKSYGFIITRHVNSVQTNKYWNLCVQLIRTLYPYKQIVVIDDNSNTEFLKPQHKYKNILIISSKYKGRGELLPYIYYSVNKWFDKAVIIHDSVFFHKRIAFERIDIPAIPLWKFDKPHLKTHLNNSLRLANALKYSNNIKQVLLSTNNWYGCFGVQTYIKHSFLTHIMNKYNINNLVHYVKCREDRCSLERIFGAIYFLELNTSQSILGDIFSYNFGYTYEKYINDIQNKKLVTNVVKVYTGR
jgi:hypothetical protein